MTRGDSAPLLLIGRRECHLCEVMASELRAIGDARLAFDEIDVDGDAQLRAAWGLRVPVLLDGDQVLCEGRLDQRRIRAWLAADG